MMDIKQEILSEISSRIERLQKHEDDVKPCEGNQYAELNHALSSVIGSSLEKELENLKGYIEAL